jgi:hypothetical protein
MEEYHAIWLSNHPDRDEVWLRGQLAEGFDIHHLDGDRDNNIPENLVLIEHLDHMRLHGLKFNRLVPIRVSRSKSKEPKAPKPKKPTQRETMARGEISYLLAESGLSWRVISFYDKNYTEQAAEAHAQQHGLEWPIKSKENI